MRSIGTRLRNAGRHLHRREEGQAAIEFLLILPFFVLFILMTVDLGVAMYEYVSVSNAAREGARFGAVNCGNSGTCTLALIQQRVVDRSGGIITNTADVTVRYRDVNGIASDGSTGRGDSVVVKVNHQYSWLFFPVPSLTVYSCADMRLEQKDRGSGLTTGTGC